MTIDLKPFARPQCYGCYLQNLVRLQIKSAYSALRNTNWKQHRVERPNFIERQIYKCHDKECEFTKELRINYDLIEVKEGWCFWISQRKFVLYPIGHNDIGKESPRAFIDYEHTKEPSPGYFKEILNNSLNQTEIEHFCEYKEHKERVLCLIGQPNGGKTSLFTPIARIIPTR